MRRKIYYLSTCDTCKRIINELSLKTKDFEFQDIKFDSITAKQLEEMKEVAGSYEALFSKRSRQYAALGLKDKTLSEKQLKEYILKEYTFLKRPVIWYGDRLFVGNAKKTIAEAKDIMDGDSSR